MGAPQAQSLSLQPALGFPSGNGAFPGHSAIRFTHIPVIFGWEASKNHPLHAACYWEPVWSCSALGHPTLLLHDEKLRLCGSCCESSWICKGNEQSCSLHAKHITCGRAAASRGVCIHRGVWSPATTPLIICSFQPSFQNALWLLIMTQSIGKRTLHPPRFLLTAPNIHPPTAHPGAVAQ